MSETELRRQELSEFLRTRRAAIGPEEVGLAPGVRRRTPGLRREELALLAGVGVTWYTWLEQGREINPSPEVLGSLARTLRLDRAETDYLFRLAGVRTELPRAETGADIPAPLLRLMHAQSPAPAWLIDADWEIRAWNPSADALFGFSTLAPEECNLALAVFGNPLSRRQIVDWERHARRTVAELRSAYAARGGEHAPAARRLAEIIERLRAEYPEAAAWLDEHRVEERTGTEKDLESAVAGRLCVDQLVLTAQHGLQLVVMGPRDEETADRFHRLAQAAPQSAAAPAAGGLG